MTRKLLVSLAITSMLWPLEIRAQSAESKLAALAKLAPQERRHGLHGSAARAE